MFRLVFVSLVGIFLVCPAFAQETTVAEVTGAVPIPSPTPPMPPAPLASVAPALSARSKPGSSIAQSAFAVAKRDAAFDHAPASHPLLQATAPSTRDQVAQLSVSPTRAPQSVASLAQPHALAPPPKTAHEATVAVSLPVDPLFPSSPREVAAPPVASAPPKAALPETPAPVRPKDLASRAALRERARLVQLYSDLGAEEPRLNRSQESLARSQRQLGVFTSVLRSAMADAGDEGSGLHPFVRVAQRYLGTPYVWGGESARGFDCSGFIMRVMRDLGYRALPHSAAEQFRYGTPIAREALKPGDVVFFANTYKPGVSHVGIYLGRGRFIHAANSRVGTIISSLNEPKWIEHWAGARRLVSGG